MTEYGTGRAGGSTDTRRRRRRRADASLYEPVPGRSWWWLSYPLSVVRRHSPRPRPPRGRGRRPTTAGLRRGLGCGAEEHSGNGRAGEPQRERRPGHAGRGSRLRRRRVAGLPGPPGQPGVHQTEVPRVQVAAHPERLPGRHDRTRLSSVPGGHAGRTPTSRSPPERPVPTSWTSTTSQRATASPRSTSSSAPVCSRALQSLVRTPSGGIHVYFAGSAQTCHPRYRGCSSTSRPPAAMCSSRRRSCTASHTSLSIHRDGTSGLRLGCGQAAA